jgi:hypothetical protein
MKKLVAVAAVTLCAVMTLSVSTVVSAASEPTVDQARVNAKVDARLRQVLQGLLAERAR